MKKIILFASALLVVSLVSAQTPQRPTGTPGKVPLVTPKLKIPADLVVRCSGITSSLDSAGGIGFTPRTYFFILKVTVTITNAGQIPSKPAGRLKAYVILNPKDRRLISPALQPARNFNDKGSLDGTWVSFIGSSGHDFGVIEPGASFSQECRYIIEGGTYRAVGNDFFFSILVDANDATMEGNEDNNISPPVAIYLRR